MTPTTGKQTKYQSGFGNEFATEARTGVLLILLVLIKEDVKSN